MKNNLSDLNNQLFEMLDKLQDDEEMQDKEAARRTIDRAQAMCKVSSQILSIARIQLTAIKTAEDCGLHNNEMPALIATKDSKDEQKKEQNRAEIKRFLEGSST
ncbi:MAG: hypothetical protein IIZ93_09040 [Acidaminococcaceae bacterium]|nr:hypothetical protein [Acidaminococcaceae bacterium]